MYLSQRLYIYGRSAATACIQYFSAGEINTTETSVSEQMFQDALGFQVPFGRRKGLFQVYIPLQKLNRNGSTRTGTHTTSTMMCVSIHIFFFWKFAAFAIFGFSPAGLYSSACLLFVLLSFSFFFFYFRIKKKPMETTGWGRGWRVESAVAEKRWPRRMYEGRCCESCRELFCDWQAKNRFPPCFCFVFLFSFYFFQAIRQRAAPAQGDYQQWHGYGYGQYVYVFDVII